MIDQERQKIKERIIVEIEKTGKDIVALQELVKPISPDNAVGRLSRMEAINTKSVNEAALGAARRKLVKLKWAGENIDKPGFGICHECDEPIPMGRILLMPESNLCVQCAEELE
jgi:DnaK suppressor protein